MNDQFSTGLLGGTTESVARKSPKPVLVSPAEFREVTKPLLAYDGSQRAGAAMHTAAEVTSALGLPLTVLHVARNAADGETVLAEARRYLDAYDIAVTYQVLTGPPHQVIIDTLTAGAHDLLFIGAYGHSRIIEMVLGSTTEYVLRNSSAPVFLTR